MLTWAGLFVPQKTPRDIVSRLHETMIGILKEPDVAKRLAELGYVPGGQPQAAFASQVRDEKDRWAVLIGKAGVKLN